MNDVVESRPQLVSKEHFGACPACGNRGWVAHVGPDYWFLCDTHKTRWFLGSALNRNWEVQTDGEKAELMRDVAGYREVEPNSSSAQPVAVVTEG